MNILGCLDTPSEGEYHIHGQSVSSLNPDQLSALRLKTFRFVFQRYQLLSSLNATENVALPAIYSGTSSEDRTKSATVADKLGLSSEKSTNPESFQVANNSVFGSASLN